MDRAQEGRAVSVSRGRLGGGWKWKVINSGVDQRHRYAPRIFWDESLQRSVAYSQHSHRVHAGCAFGRLRVEALNPEFEPYGGFAAAIASPFINRTPGRSRIRRVGGAGPMCGLCEKNP